MGKELGNDSNKNSTKYKHPMILEVAKAKIEDLGPLALLFNDYRIFYGYDSDVDGAKKFLLERMNNNESILFISKLGQSATGFIQLYPLFSSTKMKRLWLLNDLYVSEAFRGKGISKALIAASKEFAINTNACGLLLETAKTNTIGNRLYPSMEFILEEDSNFYFWNNK
jgi:ribosomal protein S18 acetylase RimI-like enzyme